MKEFLESILKLGYTQYKGQGTSNGREVLRNFHLLEDEIQKEANSFGMKAKFKEGSGRWTTVPYLRVFYQDLFPSAQYGVYIVYLFAASGKSVFITLNQGTSKSSPDEISKIKKNIQTSIKQKQFLSNTGILNIGDDKGYGSAAIFYKEYTINNLPSDNELKNDIRYLMSIYKECKDKGLLDSSSSSQAITNTKPPILEATTNRTGIFKISSFTNNQCYIQYITSLLAKPFVILTGNSGTG